MNLMDFVKANRVYLDGAMGSELIKRGLDTSKAEQYNITNPEIIYDIHKGYLDCGCNIIYTNTFGCNQLKYNVSNNELSKIINSGINIAKKAIFGHSNTYIAYSCGPLTELLKPYGSLTFEEAYEFYRVQAEAIKNTQIDLVVIETITDTLMLKAAILAFKETTTLPIWCSMSFNDNGRTFNGSSIGSFALIAQGLNVDAIGINCSLGPNRMIDLAKELIKYSSCPIFIKPNAGLPVFENGHTSYNIDANGFAYYMAEIAKTGISILGGCCGTDPEYLQKTIDLTHKIPFKIFNNNIDAVCSATSLVKMKAPLVIGERVNPTGKPLLKQAIVDEDYDYIISMCIDQLDKNADILDINVGMGGIDETDKIIKIITAIQGSVDCPIQIDSSRLSAVKGALRIVNGIPIINSVNGDDKSLDSLLPLAKKYGAYVVGICLDKNGIPETMEGRLKIANKIIDRAKYYGIPKHKLLLDALTLAVSVDTKNGLITLDTVKALNDKGIKTVLGLSNISYGLPAREIINSNFYKMTQEYGLFSAIINPSTKPCENVYAKNLLLDMDKNCKNFVNKYSGFVAEQIIANKNLTIFDCVVKGLKADGLKLVKAVVTENNYNDIIQKDIIKGLNELGHQYDIGRAFLPQLISSAESASSMLNYIKEKFIKTNSTNGHVMLIATVKGDVHDIGKNIVKAVLGNYGYKIYDLGKDVDISEIIIAIDKYNPEIIGLSALMTTTLDNMKLSVDAIKKRNKNIIVMVGGAVVTEKYAKSIDADIYSVDAQDAVKKLNKFFVT